MERIDIIALTVLFIVSFSIWSLPMQEQEFPFGEGDAVHQFGKADYIANFDRVPVYNPFFYAAWYNYDEEIFYTPANAPYYMVNAALMQVIGGHRFLPMMLYIAIVSNFLVVFSSYFLIKKLYGRLYGLLSAFLLIFPFRNVMSYVWGQRTILMGLSFVPLILYSYYKYIAVYLDNPKENKHNKYLIVLCLLLAMSGFFHPMSLIASVFPMMVFTIVVLIKYKKLPFNFKYAMIAFILFCILFLPFARFYFIAKQEGFEAPTKPLSALFKWFYVPPSEANSFMYSYPEVHGGYWTLPFLFLGIFILLIKRRKQDMFLLSWLIGLYLALHIESFMSVPLGLDRVLKSSSYLFYPLIVIGFLGIANFFKDKKVRTVAKVALSSLFFILLISSNANKAYTTLKQAYPPILRMTPAQYEAAQWIDENLAEYVIIYSIGTITYPKTRWIHMFSHKATIPGIYVSMEKAANITIDFPLTKKVTHLLVDYSDYLLINNQDKINEIKLFEEKYASDASLLYDKQGIKVFELED